MLLPNGLNIHQVRHLYHSWKEWRFQSVENWVPPVISCAKYSLKNLRIISQRLSDSKERRSSLKCRLTHLPFQFVFSMEAANGSYLDIKSQIILIKIIWEELFLHRLRWSQGLTHWQICKNLLPKHFTHWLPNRSGLRSSFP